MERQAFIDAVAALYEPPQFRNYMMMFKNAGGTTQAFEQMEDEFWQQFIAAQPALLVEAKDQPPVAGADPMRAKQMYHLIAPADDKAGKIFKELKEGFQELKKFAEKMLGESQETLASDRFKGQLEKKKRFVERCEAYAAALASAGDHPYPKLLADLGYDADVAAHWGGALRSVEGAKAKVPETSGPAAPASASGGSDEDAGFEEFLKAAEVVVETYKQQIEWLRNARLPELLSPRTNSDEDFEKFMSSDIFALMKQAQGFEQSSAPGMARILLSFAKGLPNNNSTLIQSVKLVLAEAKRNAQAVNAGRDVADAMALSAIQVARLKRILGELEKEGVEGLPTDLHFKDYEFAIEDAAAFDAAAGASATAKAEKTAAEAAAKELEPYFRDKYEKFYPLVDALAGHDVAVPVGKPAELFKMKVEIDAFDLEDVEAKCNSCTQLPDGKLMDFRDKVLTIRGKFQANLEESWAPGLLAMAESGLKEVNGEKYRGQGLVSMATARESVKLLRNLLPGINVSSLDAVDAFLVKHLDPLQAQFMAAGSLHEENLGQARFSSKALDLGKGEAAFDDIIDVNGECYAYMFVDYPPLWMSEGGNWAGFHFALLEGADHERVPAAELPLSKQGDKAWVRIGVIPSEKEAYDERFLLRMKDFICSLDAGKVHELEVVVSTGGRNCTGVLKLDMTTFDKAKFEMRMAKLAAIAEKRAADDVELPEIFNKPYAGIKEPTMSKEKLEEAAAAYIENIKRVVSFRLAHFRDVDFNVEKTPLGIPTQRLTTAAGCIVWEDNDGKFWVANECLTFRQYWQQQKGSNGDYGEDITVLFFDWNPKKIAAEKIKHLKD